MHTIKSKNISIKLTKGLQDKKTLSLVNLVESNDFPLYEFHDMHQLGD